MTKHIDYDKLFLDLVVCIVGFLLGSSVVHILFPHPTEYRKGIIFVEFMPGVTEENITLIIHSYNCTVYEWYGGTSETGIKVYVNVPVGKEKEYVRLFKENDAVYDARLEWAKV